MNKIILSLLAGLIIFTGCASPCYDRHGVLYNPDDVVVRLDLQKTFDEVALQMCGYINVNSVPTKTVLVTDFVDVETFQSNGSGMFMSEMLKSSLNQKCNYTIAQAEFSKFFKLNRGGLLALTRDAKEVKHTEVPIGATAIVGTFKYSPTTLHLFVREINTYSGKISKFITKEIPFTCMGDSVFRTDFEIKTKK